MKTAIAIVAFQCLTLISPSLPAADRFYQAHRERSRPGIPNYAYRTGKSPAVLAVMSEPAIPLPRTTATTTAGSAAATVLQVNETGRAFVFDDLRAGPLVLTSLGAKTDSHGCLIVTGIIIHTGGDSGQLLGGKAVLRVEPLTSTGTTAKNSTILACKEASCWVRRNEPEAVQICLPDSCGTTDRFGEVERVRVFLEYHANR